MMGVREDMEEYPGMEGALLYGLQIGSVTETPWVKQESILLRNRVCGLSY